jgi:hypothetical protein
VRRESDSGKGKRSADEVRAPKRSAERESIEPADDGNTEASDQSASSVVARDVTGTYDVAGGMDEPVGVEDVWQRWPSFLDALRPKDLSLEALMRSCEPVSVDADVVVLSFAHGFHRSKVEDEKKRRIVEDTLSGVFGRRLRVRCVTGVAQGGRTVPDTGDGAGGTREGNEEDGPVDPLVRMALDELGAEVARHED